MDVLTRHQRRRAECIRGQNTDSTGFKDCPIDETQISRTCATMKDYMDQLKANSKGGGKANGGGSGGAANANVRSKRDDAKAKGDGHAKCNAEGGCGCPEQKMYGFLLSTKIFPCSCDECYELSDLHDHVHGLQRKIHVLEAKCGVAGKAKHHDDHNGGGQQATSPTGAKAN